MSSRYTAKSPTTAAIILSLIAVSCLRAAMPRFECHTIAEIGWGMGQTALVDIDRDGDLDWVVG